jgi:hypothetical protein
VELGEGVIATCQIQTPEATSSQAPEPRSTDVGSLSAMLSAKWKQGGGSASTGGKPPARAGEIRSFRISNLDPAKKLIELELAS